MFNFYELIFSQTYDDLPLRPHTAWFMCTIFSSKTKGFEKEERLVYQIIEDSGSKGIWIREIRIKSNLPQQQIVKTLKTLESKKLIKSVKSVQQGLKKKVYMLADLAPDESVTGGAWYSDQDFESEFVEVLNQQCLKYLQHKVSSSCLDGWMGGWVVC